MRTLTLQMMTTLNGRLDDPGAWVSPITEDLYSEIDRVYAAFDTILVGHATYAEMFGYWPAAEEEGTETNRRMARRMNATKKWVLSRSSPSGPLAWSNAERVQLRSDEELTRFVTRLKEQPGGGIHLAGGAKLARTFVRLGLVDEYRFFVHPVVSDGASWFGELAHRHALNLVETRRFEGGVVGLHYRPDAAASGAPPRQVARFTELLR